MQHVIVHGKIKRGLRIASGLNPDPTLRLNNTIALQKPFFIKEGIPCIEEYYNGTINVDIAPRMFRILEHDYEITCEWHPKVEETFWLVEVSLIHNEISHSAYIYYPCPSEVKSHKDDTIELLAKKIDGALYGDPLSIVVPLGKVEFFSV